MEQSREGYQHKVDDVGKAKKYDAELKTRSQYESEADQYVDGLIQLTRKVLGRDAAGAERRVKEYIEQGHAEATELNVAFEKLKIDLEQTEKDLIEYAEAHKDVVDENTQGYKQLGQRVEDAVNALRMFQIEKLGMPAEEEQDEAA